MSDKKKKSKWTRRAFIGTSAVLGTGLVVGVAGNFYVNKKIKKYTGTDMGEGSMLNAWLKIAPDNSITVAVPRAEMGQGVYTSLPMMVAEELEVEMNSIKVVHPQPESPYANTFVMTQKEPNAFKGYSMSEKLYAFLPLVVTGGSTTVADGFNNMRLAGATAREMLKEAASKRWEVSISDCKAEKGYIVNLNTNEKLSYGSLAEDASKIDLEDLPELKKKKDWKIIGTPSDRLDIPDKVTAKAEFGIDVRLPDMLYAVVRHPATIGGKITSVLNADEIEARPGVKKVIITDYCAAVIADNTWRARNASLAMELEEDDGGNADISSTSISEKLQEILKGDPIATHEDEGDVGKILNDNAGNEIVEAQYYVPYLAHATMEPMNCTVWIKEDSAEVWVGHQGSSLVQNAVNEVSGISKSKIKVNITYLGGGFGRRSEQDFVRIATAIAAQMPGVPIQTVFTREEDMRNDVYRPAVAASFKAKLSSDGEIEAWDNMLALQSVSHGSVKRVMPIMAPSPKKDEASTEGARHLPYKMKNRRVAFGDLDLPIQVGFWRSVGSSQNAFFTESFMDECAHAAGMDPFKFRQAKLADHPRFLAVLNKVAEISSWESKPAENTYRGIALHKSFGSIVGQVAEISKQGENEFSIDRFYNVIDCGNVINPNTVEAQMESGIIFGLTAAVYGEITWSDGAVDQFNFPQYDMLRLKTAPRIENFIMDVDEYPGGVGEPGTPPAAPALVNALFAATGKRYRSLPLAKQGLKFV